MCFISCTEVFSEQLINLIYLLFLLAKPGGTANSK